MERRNFLTGGLAGIAGSSSTLSAKQTPASGGRPGRVTATSFGRQQDVNPQPLATVSNDLSPYTGPWSDRQLMHLLSRSMFGVPFSQFEAAKKMAGMTAVIDQLVDSALPSSPQPPKPGAWIDQLLMPDRTITDPVLKQKDINNKQRQEQMRDQQIRNWWLDLMIKEHLSIREKLTLFWSNHFVTATQSVRSTPFIYTYLETLRKNCAGNFKQFAETISKDPAMILYLNSDQNYTRNNKPHINENYARELMELFTVGLVDPKSPDPTNPLANYTEDDVQAAAKALTGWLPSLAAPWVGIFQESSHDKSTVTFLGHTGSYHLEDIVDFIFEKDGGYTAAWFISQKLYAAFVYYVPNPQVVDAMAKLLVQSNFEIAPVMKALLSSAHFYDENVIGAQLKSPTEFMAGLVRQFNLVYQPFNPSDPPLNGTDAQGINRYTDTNPTLTYVTAAIMGFTLGQDLLNPPNVKGWPGGHNWIGTGTFTQREIFSYLILNNYYDGNARGAKDVKLTFDPLAWANSLPGVDTMTSDQIAQGLESRTSAFTFGEKQGGDLHLVLTGGVPEVDFYLEPKKIQTFAQVVATFPEYQLV
jgi:uncharacterized protein (DUF1800 family)